MPLYRCTVLDALGKKNKVVRTATDASSLRGMLKQESYHLLSAKIVRSSSHGLTLFASGGKRKSDDTVLFLRQFAVMVRAGIPIGEALNSLRKQKFSASFRNALHRVYFDVTSGSLLSEAFERHPRVFPRFLVRMIEVGEESGSLDTVLSALGDYYENDRRFKMKVSSSMAYPAVLLCMVLAVALFVMLFILPQFEAVFDELDGEVPRMMALMMELSAFLQTHVFGVFAAFFACLLLLWMGLRTKRGKFFKDWLLCRMPLVGNLQKEILTARFSKALALMLRSGMNMMECLEQMKRLLGNQVYERALAFVIAELKRGRRMAPSLAATGLFSPVMVEMLNAGEKSGEVEEVLDAAGAYCDVCVESTLAKAIAVMEPLNILLLGGIVATVLFSVLLPMMSLMNSI